MMLHVGCVGDSNLNGDQYNYLASLVQLCPRSGDSSKFGNVFALYVQSVTIRVAPSLVNST